MKLKLLLSAITLSATQVFAQVTLDQSNTGTSSTRSIVDNLQSCLQTFEAGISGTLNQVKIDIETQNCPYALVCRIYDGLPGSTELTNEVVTVPINTPRNLYTINFSTPANLTAGNTYTIGVYANCISGPGYSIFWYKSVADNYDFGQAYVQNGSTPAAEDSLNDFYFQTYVTPVSGISENSLENVKVFPNPANDIIRLQIDDTKNYTYSLVDQTGRIILDEANSINNTIDVSGIENGYYFVMVSDGKLTGTYPIVIQR